MFHPLEICWRDTYGRGARNLNGASIFLDWMRVSEGWRSNFWLLFVYTAEAARDRRHTRNAAPFSRTDEQYVISGRVAYLGAFIFNTFANRRLVEQGASSNPSGHSADPSQERTYSL